MQNQPKTPIKYKFHCTICGTEFRPSKKHARTCSTVCRVTLSNIMRYNVDSEDPNQEPPTKEQLKKIESATKVAKGEVTETVVTKISKNPLKKSSTQSFLGRKKKE